MLPKYINDVLDRGYEVFKNNPIKVAENLRPTKELIKDAAKQFQDIAATKIDDVTRKTNGSFG